MRVRQASAGHERRGEHARGLRRGAMAAVAAVALLVVGREATAQQAARPANARLSGTVRDTAGVPIAAAGVEIDHDGVWRAVSPDGGFVVTELAAGPHVLRIRALGFGPMEQGFVLAPGDSATADVVLARAALALDTVRTSAVAPRYGPTEFQERRLRGRGTFLTRETFERSAPSRLSDLLVSLPGVQRVPIPSRLGTTEYVYVMRGVSTVGGKSCPVNVYVDGRNYDLGPEDLDRLARPQEIDAVEVYSGASQIPPRFGGPTAYCGVIALWTRGTTH